MDDILKILIKYIVPMFDPNTSNHVIVSSHSKSQEIAQSFFLMDHPAQVIKVEDVYAENIFQVEYNILSAL